MPTPARRQPPEVAHLLELLAPLGRPIARAMFGGHGVYLDGLFVAIVVDGRSWLKAGEAEAARFAASGSEPYRYAAAGRTLTMGFWRVPDEALDDASAFAPWGRLAIDAALRARAARRPSTAVGDPEVSRPRRPR